MPENPLEVNSFKIKILSTFHSGSLNYVPLDLAVLVYCTAGPVIITKVKVSGSPAFCFLCILSAARADGSVSSLSGLSSSLPSLVCHSLLLTGISELHFLRPLFMSIPNQYFWGITTMMSLIITILMPSLSLFLSLFTFIKYYFYSLTSNGFHHASPSSAYISIVAPPWWPSHFLQLCSWFPHSALLSVLWSPSSSSPPMSCSRVISVFTLTLLLDGLLPSISRRICPQYPLSPLITFSKKLEQMGHLSPSDLVWSNLIQPLIFLLFLSSSFLSGGNSPSWDTMNDWKFTALHRGLKNKKSTATVCPLSVLTGEEVTCVLGESPYVHRLDLKCWLDTMVREYFERTPQSSSRI